MMAAEFWLCSECGEWCRRELEIVEVVAGIKSVYTYAGAKPIADVEFRQFCPKCLAHLRKNLNPVLPPPSHDVKLYDSRYEGYWLCLTEVTSEDIERARPVLRETNPIDLPQININNQFWVWKELSR